MPVTHTRTHRGDRGIGGCMFSSFPQSHPTQPKHGLLVLVVIILCLFDCYRLFSCCIYVVVYFQRKKGKPGRVSKGGKGRGK